jgi:hypothetical protein
MCQLFGRGRTQIQDGAPDGSLAVRGREQYRNDRFLAIEKPFDCLTPTQDRICNQKHPSLLEIADYTKPAFFYWPACSALQLAIAVNYRAP